MQSIAEKIEKKINPREAATDAMVMFVRMKGGRQRFLFSDSSYLDFGGKEVDVGNEVYFDKTAH